MENQNNQETVSSYNDLKQVDMSIKAAEKMVGSATMSMDPEQLQDAKQTIQNAKEQFQHAKANNTGVDDKFFHESSKLLQHLEKQLTEAQQ